MTTEQIENMDKEDLLSLLGYYNNYVVEFFDTHEEGMRPVSIYEFFENDYQEIIEEQKLKEFENEVIQDKDIKTITEKEFNILIEKLNNQEEFTDEEKQSFLMVDKKDDSFIAIDNRNGNMWTEEFKEKEYAIRYLQGEEIDKLRDEECKYEIRIYETEEDYNKGEPFQLNVYSDFEEAKNELKKTINFNNYFSGNIINQQNGIEEFSYYSNKETEKYSYIFECTLEASSKLYEHQFLLVKDPNDLETNFEIDLTGGFDFNCAYRVINPKLVQIINSKEELEDFCQKHNIDIPKYCIREDGIIASGPDGLLINNNLEAIDWLDNLELEKEEIQE